MELATMADFCLNAAAVSGLGIQVIEDESEAASPINDPKKLTSDASSVESEQVRENLAVPSTAAQFKAMQLTQTRSDVRAVFNGLPAELVGPPITIYHPVFSQFLADLTVDLASLGLNEQILAEVDNFCMKSREFMVEDGRADVLGKSLQKLLSDAFARITLYLMREKTPVGFLEDKRGMGSGGCDPTHQGEKDYQLALSDARKVSAMPSLLISTVGSEMAVTGLITIRGVVVSQRLLNYTSLVGLVPTALPYNSPWVSPEDYHHACVARIFRALTQAIDALVEYYAELEPPSEEPIPCLMGPAPHFSKFISSENITYTISYTKRFVNRRNSLNRTVYLAICTPNNGGNPIQCVVKFATSYSVELHRRMAEKLAAPKLLYWSKESSVGGLHVIIMQYIDQENRFKVLPEAFQQLQNVVAEMHRDGYVFGDLRLPNILIGGDGGLLVIEYDWSGKGERFYPRNLNLEVHWPKGVGRGKRIMPEHDRAQLLSLEEFLCVPASNKRAITDVEDPESAAATRKLA
ncbi:hypothetical protein DFH09DRAFT_1090897 [Mycena vulgaris]|nr:hypothetical protein DFH09DRAFT_1090897 [Mycena vulgaris]